MNSGVVAIIQARMGSTRFPKKVVLPLCGKPVLWHVVNRLFLAKRIESVVVATSIEPINDEIRDLCRKGSINCFSGSENDVLDRFYQAAKENKANHVLRITADCPLLEPKLIDRVIAEYFEKKYDYCSVATGAGVANEVAIKRYPDGLDAEVFSFRLLEEAWKEATDPLHREHVTPFLWKQPERYLVGKIVSPVDYSQWRLTLDHPQDYDLICWIYEQLYPKSKSFDLAEIVTLLKAHPEQLEKNRTLSKQQNYQEFWREEKK